MLQNAFFPLVLLFIALLLCVSNYTPGTFLSGWDTLHPEFDFKLNFLRTFFGVFRPEQGLGAVAAHAHMVELPRIIILYALHFFFPLSMLRYLYIFLCLIAGPLGMYFFLNRIVIKKQLPSFLGALFYLLNLGTYQTFVVPFEMFTTLYATIPFVFWLFSEYLLKHKKRYIVFFSIAIILASPAAYASTLWLVFFASLLIFFTPYVFYKRKTKGIVKRFIWLLTIIILLNLYWLLPNLYFASTTATTVTGANINKLFSEEAFLKNKEFGTVANILGLKSFYFDWGIYSYDLKAFQQLTSVFQDYLHLTVISVIGWLFSILLIVGFIFGVIKQKAYRISIILLLLFCLLFLFNDNQPFKIFFSLLQNHAPLFKEAARFPDNKILNSYILLCSIFFGFASLFIYNLLSRVRFSIILNTFFGIILSLLLIIYLLPGFAGNFIHPTMRVKIPLEYFSLFERLHTENAGRVANFPVSSPWGWVYHDWYDSKAPSFQGAGFLYFGMPQAILERDFDRWNTANEQYYREVSHAVYSQNILELKNVIQKYDITHLLVDTSVINAGSDSKNLYYAELFSMLNTLSDQKFISKIDLPASNLVLYKVQNTKRLVTSIYTALPVKNPSETYFKDYVYEGGGNYVSDSSGLEFPLQNILDNEYKLTKNIFKKKGDEISLVLPAQNYRLADQNFRQATIPSQILVEQESSSTTTNLNFNLYPSTPLFDNKTALSKLDGAFVYPSAIKPVMSVNRQVFELNNLQDNTPTAVGNAFLSASLNKVAVYSEGQDQLVYQVYDIPFSFGYCNGNNNADLNILARPDSLVLRRPQKDPVCINVPLSFVKTPDNTSSTLVTFRFSSKSKINACLTSISSSVCREYLPVNNFFDPAQLSFALDKNDLSTTKLIITVERGQENQTLNNLSATSQQALSETLLDSTLLTTTIPKTFTNITFPYTSDKNYQAKAQAQSSLESDCPGQENKSSKSFDETDSSYRYVSEKGSYCDHISFPNLPHSLSYLVYVKSKNTSGLPMTFCITNYTSRRCDIYAKLTKFATPSEDVFLLPPSDPTGTGYDVNLENVGITRTEAINNFYSVSFVPIPIDLFSQIVSGTAAQKLYPGTVSNTIVYNPSLITTEVKNGPALISLSYAYDKGFAAYEVSCKSTFCPFTYLLRPLFGSSLKHVEINGWKNGWEAPSSSTVLIIYLPQYLEYIGIFSVAIFMTIILSYPLLNHFMKNKLDDYFEKKAERMKKRLFTPRSK